MTEKKGLATVCGSHERIDESISRQERILDEIKRENTSHLVEITRSLAEICEQLKSVAEIRATLGEHNRRRDDDTRSCEDKRTDIWIEMNRIKARQDKKDGSMVLVASFCTGVGAAVAWLLTWLQKHL
ncbi:MAG: hypothetical protein VR65_25455 [Desulfobulbaceae bacterium BRH_c16a]|nr:MAG: hypothetical protein VR65_25455 [Desulfobulbaceae bacterium BRH_c16a]